MSAGTSRLRSPAYAKELRARRAAGETINLHVQVGAGAWRRANRSGHRPRLVIDLGQDLTPEDFDFRCCDDLDLVMNATGCDLELARALAVRICKHGARLVVMLHPDSSEFFYGQK